MTGAKHVVFDIVGTCVSFDAYFAAIDTAIGQKLHANTITPKFFGYSWMTAAELEFTFLSVSERYKPYKEVLRSTFFRTLWFAGVQEPRQVFTEEECNACVQGYSELQLRSDTKECFEKLRNAGFTVWCLTTADTKRVQGYFEKGGAVMPAENIISCDSASGTKPALSAYRPALEKLGDDGERWFAAAHMWDVSAAKKVGFKGAYCSVLEKESCIELYDTEMDVTSDTLVKMAEGIIAASS